MQQASNATAELFVSNHSELRKRCTSTKNCTSTMHCTSTMRYTSTSKLCKTNISSLSSEAERAFSHDLSIFQFYHPKHTAISLHAIWLSFYNNHSTNMLTPASHHQLEWKPNTMMQWDYEKWLKTKYNADVSTSNNLNDRDNSILQNHLNNLSSFLIPIGEEWLYFMTRD